MLITGFGIQCFQQITGIDATVYYSPTILKDAGIKSDNKLLAATIAVGFTKTIFILVAILLIDRVGRKPLLYVSTIGMTICLFGLGLALSLLRHELVSRELGIGAAIFAVSGNVAFFSIGIAPICWVLSSEIFPLRLRAQASAHGAVGNRVSSGLIAMSFLSMSHVISVEGTFFIFSALLTCLFQKPKEQLWSRLRCYFKMEVNDKVVKWSLEMWSIWCRRINCLGGSLEIKTYSQQFCGSTAIAY